MQHALGFRHLFEQTGFAVERIEWLEGYMGALGYLMRMASHELAKLDKTPYSPIDRRILKRAELETAQLGQTFNEMDLRRLETSVGFPLNYVVHATKP